MGTTFLLYSLNYLLFNFVISLFSYYAWNYDSHQCISFYLFSLSMNHPFWCRSFKYLCCFDFWQVQAFSRSLESFKTAIVVGGTNIEKQVIKCNPIFFFSCDILVIKQWWLFFDLLALQNSVKYGQRASMI